MSGWKIDWVTYLEMQEGLKEYPLHTFEVADGNVVIKKDRVRQDLLSWANDGVLPERPLQNGEVRERKQKKTDGDWGALRQMLLQNTDKLENPHEDGDHIRARCPSCAEAGRDRSGVDFWLLKEGGFFGCHNTCESTEVAKAVMKLLDYSTDTSQKEEEAVEEEFSATTEYKEIKTEVESEVQSEPDIPGKRLVKNTDHHTVEHHLLDSPHPEIICYAHVETSKATGKETTTERAVEREAIRKLWTSIISHQVSNGLGVIGSEFTVSDLWDSMNMDRTSQSEKYSRWNYPSDVLILLGVIERITKTTYKITGVFR